MRSLSPVVWSEGMYLGPHEFQAQARYFEDAIHFAAAAFGSGYGLMGSTLDARRAAQRNLNLRPCLRHFPGRTSFPYSAGRAAPATRAIADLFPAHPRHPHVFLGLNRYRQAGATVPGRPTPARAILRPNSAGSATRPAARMRAPVAHPAQEIRCPAGTGTDDETVSLPWRASTATARGISCSIPDFVPPCLQITASETVDAYGAAAHRNSGSQERFAQPLAAAGEFSPAIWPISG